MATVADRGRDLRELAKDVMLQYEMHKAVRSNWDTLWQDFVDYYVPNKADIPTKTSRTRGGKKTEKLFDSTSLDCVARLTAAMQGNLTPGPTKWFYLKMRLAELNEQHEVKEWLEECANRIRMAFNNSNFSSEMNELYQDLIVFGTGFMIEEEKPMVAQKFGGLVFKTFGVGSFCIDEDSEGMVDTVFREFTLTARQAKQKWGDEVLRSLKIKDALDKGKGRQHTRFTFLHAVYPRDTGEWDEIEIGEDKKPKPRLVSRMPIASVYICMDDKTVIHDGGHPEFPGMAPRWSKAADDLYGRGPGYLALPDVKTLNRSKELGLKAWAKEIDPPMKQLDVGVVGNKNLYPGGTTIVTDMDALQPFEFNIKHDVSKWKTAELIDAIRKVFYVDQLVLKESPQMTAEEVRARMELMQRILGPTFGRLENELLTRLIERTFAIMMRAGALPEVPAAVKEAYNNDQADIDVEYEGALARAQRNIEVEAIDSMYAFSLPLAEAGEWGPMDRINHKKAMDFRAKVKGAPASVMNSDKEFDAIQQGRQQAAADQAELAKRSETAKTAKTTAEAAVKAGEVPDDGAGAKGEEAA